MPAACADAPQIVGRFDSSMPLTMTERIGKSGRNMSMLRFAIMAGAGTVGRVPCSNAIRAGRAPRRSPPGTRPSAAAARRSPAAGAATSSRVGDTRRIVHRPVVDVVAVDGFPAPHMIEMRAEDDVFVLQARIASAQDADDVGGLEAARLRDERSPKPRRQRQNAGGACDRWRAPSARPLCVPTRQATARRLTG